MLHSQLTQGFRPHTGDSFFIKINIQLINDIKSVGFLPRTGDYFFINGQVFKQAE